MLIAVSRQSTLQLFCQLLPTSGGHLHRLLGRLRAETVGFRSDLFRHQSPPASLCHCSTRFRHTEVIERSAIHLFLRTQKRGHFTLPTGKVALKGFRMMIFREIDRDNDNFSVLLVSKPYRLKKMFIELHSHLGHFLGEFGSAQCNRGRAHVRLQQPICERSEPSEVPRVPTNSDCGPVYANGL